MEKNRIKLLEVFIENDSIEYEFNLQEEEVIISNSMLLCGILLKIQKNLLDADQLNQQVPQTDEIPTEEDQEKD
jgi:hypothetical protein